MQKEYQVKVLAKVDDSEVKGLESVIGEMDGDSVNVGVAVDDEELLNAQDEEDTLNDTAGFNVDVDDSDLLAAQEKEEALNGSASFHVDVDGLDGIAGAEGTQAISQGIDQAKQGIGELYGGFQDTLDVAGQVEQNKAFLSMNLGAEKADKSLKAIQDTVASMPGDDNTMTSILSSAEALGANLKPEEMVQATSAMADYMAGSAKMGKMSLETQQDLQKYLLSGNTAELEKGSILSDDKYLDKLKQGNTFQERAKLLEEALGEAKFKGMASQDTLMNKQESYNGMLYKAKANLGGMFTEATKGAMDFIVQLDDITGGLAGISLAGILEFGPGLFSMAQGIFTMVPGIMMLSAEFGGLSGILGAVSGGVSGLATSFLGLSVAGAPVWAIIAAVIALGVAIYEVGKYFGWWNDLPGMFGAIADGVGKLWNAFMSNEYVIQAIDLIKQGLTDAWNAIVGFGQAIMTALFGTGPQFDILGFAIQGLQTVLDAVGPVVVWYIQTMINNFRTVYSVAQMVWPYVALAIQSALSTASNIVATARTAFQGLINIWNTASGNVQSMASTIQGALSSAGDAWNGFKDTVMNAVQPILDAVSQVSDALGSVKIPGFNAGGIETPISSGGSYGSGPTTVTQGNTIIFNMYGDVKDEKTIDDMITAINDRLNFDALSNGVNTTDNTNGVI